jgi:hypothetical protein
MDFLRCNFANLQNMNLQYISDEKGNKKAVIVPISDWNLITKNYSNLEKIKFKGDILEWQNEEVLRRIQNIDQNENLLLEEEQFWLEIEN